MDYSRIAQQIIDAVGGGGNIDSVMHCATRLRIRLRDESLCNDDRVTDIDAVKGTFNNKGQYQIILGSGVVNLVCEQVQHKLGIKEDAAPAPADDAPKGNILQRLVQLLSDIFVPIIPAIVAGGLLMGLNNVLTAKGLLYDGMSIIDANPQWADIAAMINMFSNAAFVFLPVLIGFSATKKFGGNPYLGAVMGMIMVHPDLMNLYVYGSAKEVPVWHAFGLSVEKVGYQGTVLPILASSWILAKIERKLHDITPVWLDNLTTPLLSILVSSFITFLFLGSILREAGFYLADGLTWLYTTLGVFGGAIFGFFYAPIVLTGMHQSFIAIETQLLAAMDTTGGTFIFPIAAMSNVAQGAAVLAVFFFTRDQKLRSICSASGVSALLGITEPAMFGVTLKLKYPFLGAMCGAGVGSAWLALFHIRAVALGAAGLPGFLSITPEFWVKFGIGLVLSMVVSFSVTLFLHKRNERKAAAEGAADSAATATAAPAEEDEYEGIAAMAKKKMVVAPVDGLVKPLEEAGDATFASKTMGDGFVILPENGTFVSPVDGEVTMVFNTKHAIALTSTNGTELLMHIGIDTVQLEGRGFTCKVKQGDSVKRGDLLMEVDLELIKGEGFSIETPVIVTNDKPSALVKTGQIAAGDFVMRAG